MSPGGEQGSQLGGGLGSQTLQRARLRLLRGHRI
jgi:hypothetical protein